MTRRPATGGGTPVRLWLRRVRRRVRRWLHPIRHYRLFFATVLAGLSTGLGTVYDNIPHRWQLISLAVLAVSGAMVVLLAEPPQSRGGADPDRRGLPTARPRSAPGAAGEPARQPGPARRLVRRIGEWLSRLLPRRLSRPALTLPPRDELFRGRRRDLDALRAAHDRQRNDRRASARANIWPPRRRPPAPGAAAGRRRSAASGPVVLTVHGGPGVGKTALVDELARQLAERYPHGQVYVSMSTDGAARTPSEVLQELLIALGWSEDEMPATTTGREQIFRSLTARKRMLFILDAALNAEQVRHVMPSHPTAAVIITSRRELLWPDPVPEPSHLLGPADDDDALSIFRAASGTHEGVRPECAAEIVRLCGGLPLAIRAAAERVWADGADVGQVAGLLREPRSRLTWLDRPNQSLRGDLAEEFGQLLPQEQRALAMLALVPSLTFVPWVLGPLLDLPPAQAEADAEALADRLAAAHLVADLGKDRTSEDARLQLPPLIRIFAAQQAERRPVAEREAALSRLDKAYLEVVRAALAELHPEYAGPERPAWLAGSTLPARIAAHPELWVRTEYPSLLRVIHLPGAGDEVRWRVGAWLDGCVPAGVRTGATLDAYDEAIRAAERSGAELGLIDVLLARGAYLTAVEWYPQAEASLNQAAELAAALADRGDPGTAAAARQRLVAARRRMGEGFLQAARYRRGIATLERAYRQAEVIADRGEQRLIRILLGEAHHVDTPEAAKDEELLSDTTRYRIQLSLAEGARRRAEWASAEHHFALALSLVDGDARRAATVSYRTARLLLGRAATTGVTGTDGDPGDPGLVARAARRAAAATVAFREMDNAHGEVRAYALLARAVLALGHPVEADHLARVAAARLESLNAAGEDRELLAPLSARLDRVRGEIGLDIGDYPSGRHLLMTSAATLAELDDWAALREVLRTMEAGEVAWRETDDGIAPPAFPAGVVGRQLPAAALVGGSRSPSPAALVSGTPQHGPGT
ncbi:NB-ARC domain-containing protein [Plantactinospora siamensis]|uniref:NB-ARC domain-containing protein n=1 Tax=Plantactinospora siamensis TaxID=555372 RepID=A0ABV6NSX9_9ACTN